MADLTISSTTVVPSSTAVLTQLTSGATISAGDAVYVDATDSNKVKLAQADGTAEEAAVYGIASCDASAGQPVVIVRKDTNLAIGATVAVGDFYVVSATPGGICPNADLITDDYFSIVGWTVSTSAIACDFTFAGFVTGATHA